jgi:hypothetical protein
MNLISSLPEYVKPKNVALMFFSPEPERFFPYAQIDVVQFPEGDAGDKIIEQTFTGPLHEQLRAALRYIRANVAKCEPDKQGRFVVPQILRDYAHLTENVTFLGEGDHAEIWNAEDYAAKEAAFLDTPGSLANALKELGL